MSERTRRLLDTSVMQALMAFIDRIYEIRGDSPVMSWVEMVGGFAVYTVKMNSQQLCVDLGFRDKVLQDLNRRLNRSVESGDAILMDEFLALVEGAFEFVAHMWPLYPGELTKDDLRLNDVCKGRDIAIWCDRFTTESVWLACLERPKVQWERLLNAMEPQFECQWSRVRIMVALRDLFAENSGDPRYAKALRELDEDYVQLAFFYFAVVSTVCSYTG